MLPLNQGGTCRQSRCGWKAHRGMLAKPLLSGLVSIEANLNSPTLLKGAQTSDMIANTIFMTLNEYIWYAKHFPYFDEEKNMILKLLYWRVVQSVLRRLEVQSRSRRFSVATDLFRQMHHGGDSCWEQLGTKTRSIGARYEASSPLQQWLCSFQAAWILSFEHAIRKNQT